MNIAKLRARFSLHANTKYGNGSMGSKNAQKGNMACGRTRNILDLANGGY